MDPIDKLKRYAWYCKTAYDNADMISFLKTHNVKWSNLKDIDEQYNLIHSYGQDGNYYHFNDLGRLMYFKHYHVTADGVEGIIKLMHNMGYEVEELVTWQYLTQILKGETISLSSYLLEVG